MARDFADLIKDAINKILEEEYPGLQAAVEIVRLLKTDFGSKLLTGEVIPRKLLFDQIDEQWTVCPFDKPMTDDSFLEYKGESLADAVRVLKGKGDPNGNTNQS